MSFRLGLFYAVTATTVVCCILMQILCVVSQKNFSFWGTSSPRPHTRAPPLDHAGGLPSLRPQSSFMSSNNPVRSTPLAWRPNLHHHAKLCQKWTYEISRFLSIFKLCNLCFSNCLIFKFLVSTRIGMTIVHGHTNFIKTGQMVAEILHLTIFKMTAGKSRPYYTAHKV